MFSGVRRSLPRALQALVLRSPLGIVVATVSLAALGVVLAAMLRPSNAIVPAVGRSCSRISFEVVVFPHPDSPMSPSVSPAWIAKLTPSTAFTHSGVRPGHSPGGPGSASSAPGLRGRVHPRRASAVASRSQHLATLPFRRRNSGGSSVMQRPVASEQRG